MKALIFDIISGSFVISSSRLLQRIVTNFNVAVISKHLLPFLLMRFVVVCLSFIQSGESIYNQTRLKFILWHL